MALVAMMRATQVAQNGGGRLAACAPDDPGAQPVDEVNGRYAGGIPWLADAEFARLDPDLVATEQVTLNAVYTTDPNDPNREWALASPSGQLTLTIANPEAMGYVQAGGQYRVTIERVRGPRSKEREALAQEAEQAARRA